MASVNKVILVGNVGADPETRYLPSGGSVVNISLATTENWKDKNTGEKQSKTQWHRIVFFNKLAEIAGQYIKKGAPIYIEGTLKYGQYEKDGVVRYTTEITANSMQLLGSRDGGEQSFSSGDSSSSSPAAAPSIDSDDVPF